MVTGVQTLCSSDLDGKTTETFIIPNSDAGTLNKLYASAEVQDVEYGSEAITVIATVDAKTRGKYDKYRQKKDGECDGEEDEDY